MLHKYYKYRYIALFSMLLLCMSACHTGKKAVSDSVESYSGEPARLTSVGQARDMFKAVVDSYGDWQRLRVPVTVRISSPKAVTVSGTAIFERDKSVTLSLRFFGMEIGVLQLTGDSIVVLDKHSKYYMSESVNRFLGGFPATIGNVQNLLLGHMFLLGKSDKALTETKNMDYDLFSSGAAWSCSPSGKTDGFDYGFAFNPPTVLAAMVARAGRHDPVTCTYGSPVATGAGPMAESISVDIRNAKTNISVTLEWNLSKARWNDEVEPRVVSIPRNYSRIAVEDIMKKIKNL